MPLIALAKRAQELLFKRIFNVFSPHLDVKHAV